MICEEFRETMEQEGCEVDVALNGKEGIQKIQQKKYNLVFLDESMPQMEGHKVFGKIRQISKVPVAFISGFVTPATKKKILSMGAVVFMNKPLDLDRVKTLIHTVSKQGRL